MTFAEFKTLVLRYNFDALGIKFRSFTYEEAKNDVPPRDVLVSYSAIYRNPFVEMSITYSITANYFGAMIQKSKKEYFTISEYLKSKKRTNEDVAAGLQSDETASDHFLRFISQVYELTKGELQPIILGKIWEDIPRDWMGYK